MTTLAALFATGFFTELVAGMAVNLWIATLALALGLLLGSPLGLLQLGGRLQRRIAGAVVGTMRAAPTFVVMFFLLNIIPQDAAPFGLPLVLSGRTIVALSLVPYAAAYVADNGREAVLQFRRGAPSPRCCSCPTSRARFSCS